MHDENQSQMGMESDYSDSLGDIEYDNHQGNQKDDDFVIDHGN